MAISPAFVLNELVMYFGPSDDHHIATREETRMIGMLKTILMSARERNVEAAEEEDPYFEEADDDWNGDDPSENTPTLSGNGMISFSQDVVPEQRVSSERYPDCFT